LTKESTAGLAVLFSCIFGKFLVKPIVVVNRTHKQALKTAVLLVFSVYSEVYKAVFSPTVSSWGFVDATQYFLQLTKIKQNRRSYCVGCHL
jgi:4'-phosphopantetheinyl transferase EntD